MTCIAVPFYGNITHPDSSEDKPLNAKRGLTVCAGLKFLPDTLSAKFAQYIALHAKISLAVEASAEWGVGKGKLVETTLIVRVEHTDDSSHADCVLRRPAMIDAPASGLRKLSQKPL